MIKGSKHSEKSKDKMSKFQSKRWGMPKQRFLKNTKRSAIKYYNGTPCLNWTKSLDTSGYGRLQINKKLIRAHRFAYETTYGKIPKGMCVCHHCDNPICCEPTHLFLGTQKDNMVDKYRKNRQSRIGAYNPATGNNHGSHTHPERVARGERQHLSKFTKEQIIKIRNEYDPIKNSSYKLAKKYDVYSSTILRIINKKTWKHI